MPERPLSKAERTGARLLSLYQPRPPRAELAPEKLGEKGGKPYERRLRVLLRRAWEGGVEAAVRRAAGVLDLDEERAVSEVARALFELGSVEIRADQADLVEGRWLAVEHKLVSLMHDRGLDLDLACATIGLSIDKVRQRVSDDPMLGERLEIAWLRGTARLHGAVWDQAMRGKERAGLALLQARDPRFQPTVKVEVTEQQIMASPAMKAILDKIQAVLSGVVPDGSEDYRRGWADALSEARRRAAEELG